MIPNVLISIASPLQLLNALSAVHQLRGGGTPEFSNVWVFLWLRGDNSWKDVQAENIARSFPSISLRKLATSPEIIVQFGRRRVGLMSRMSLLRAAIDGVHDAKGIREMRACPKPEWIIGRGQLPLAVAAWPDARVVWVDGGASTLKKDFKALTRPVESTAARRRMRRLGQRLLGVSLERHPVLPPETHVFSIYPREDLRLAGHPYSQNCNKLLGSLYESLPLGGASIVVSLNFGGRYVSGSGDVAPGYAAFLNYCRDSASGDVIYFPRGNEPRASVELLVRRWGFKGVDPELPVELWIPKVLGARPSVVFAGVSSAGDILDPFVAVDRFWPHL